MIGDAFSRKSLGDNLSNILRPGLMKPTETKEASFLGSKAEPSVATFENQKYSAMGTSNYTPNTNRSYDTQMVNYGF